jgi:hypothetical protein
MLIIVFFLMYLIGILWSAIHFLAQIVNGGSWISILPFVGCLIGLYYSLRLAIMLVKNANHLMTLYNMLQNTLFVLEVKQAQNPYAGKEFARELALSPQEFRARMAAKH